MESQVSLCPNYSTKVGHKDQNLFPSISLLHLHVQAILSDTDLAHIFFRAWWCQYYITATPFHVVIQG